MSTRELAARWRLDLASWAIPDEILATASESPWTLPHTVFARRARRHVETPGGPSFETEWAALDPPGTVLDVGAGAGSASLPLAPRAASIMAVDGDERMLHAFTAQAADLDVPTATVLGRWPDVATEVPTADIVTCHHVVYNVPDIEPFIVELTRHARRLVVLELTATHPLESINPLWRRFHGIERPTRPTADDALAILDSLGLEPRVRRWERPAAPQDVTLAELVDITRRRLCLPPERAEEVDAALRELGMDPDRAHTCGWSRELVTIAWTGSAAA